MKFSLATILITCAATANAFVAPSLDIVYKKADTSLHVTRRNLLEQVSLAVGSVFLTNILPANAGLLDDVKLQDLLPPEPEKPLEEGKRPSYLSEPTAEFKESESKATEFRRQQILQKKKFNEALEKLLNEKDNEEALAQEMNELQRLVIANGGLPVGVKKEEVYKQIRAKKRKGYWPTNVEIQYQKLINEVIFQQSPNIEDKEGGSKFSGGL